jgi:hypothetical protein
MLPNVNLYPARPIPLPFVARRKHSMKSIAEEWGELDIN